MTVPSRFAIEYPGRALELIELFEEQARGRDLVGSFGLLAAAAVLTIPYERMKHSHFLHKETRDSDLSAQIRKLGKAKFLSAPFWGDERPDEGKWMQSRIMRGPGIVEDWMDESNRSSLSAEANTMTRRTAEDVIRVLRNALAHGNIIYLDENHHENADSRMVYLAFLSRYEEEEAQDKPSTYRVVVTSENEFLRFVKAWARWISSFPLDGAVS